MDKAGGTAASDYLASLKEGEPIFWSSVIRSAEKALKDNIIGAMKTFALMD